MTLRQRVFWIWLAATVVWLGYYLSTRFDLVRMGAVPLSWFALEAVAPPIVLWVLWLLVRWIGRGYFKSN